VKLEEFIAKEAGVKAFSHDGGLVYMVNRQGYVKIFRVLKKLCGKYTVSRSVRGRRYKFYTGKGKIIMDITEIQPANIRKKQPDYMIVIREVK